MQPKADPMLKGTRTSGGPDSKAAPLTQLKEERPTQARLEERLQDALDRMAALSIELEEERLAKAVLEARLSAVYHSNSWRITAPLRFLKPQATPSAREPQSLRRAILIFAHTLVRRAQKMPRLRRLAKAVLPARVVSYMRRFSHVGAPGPSVFDARSGARLTQVSRIDRQRITTILGRSDPVDAISAARNEARDLLIKWQSNESRRSF